MAIGSTNVPVGVINKVPVRENLVDNWYFPKAINQRSQSFYSGAVYGIDRWRGVNDYIEVQIGSDYLTLLAGGDINNNVNIFRQRLYNLNRLEGKKVTLSILTQFVDSNIQINLTCISSNEVESIFPINIEAYGAGSNLFSQSFTLPNSINKAFINIRTLEDLLETDSICGIIAIKLEFDEGQTLAEYDEINHEWIIREQPAYIDQMTKCFYRYYRLWANEHRVIGIGLASASNNCPFVIPSPPMRVTPKKVTSSMQWRLSNGKGQNIDMSAEDRFEIKYWSQEPLISLDFKHNNASLTPGSPYFLIAMANSQYIDFNAEDDADV